MKKILILFSIVMMCCVASEAQTCIPGPIPVYTRLVQSGYTTSGGETSVNITVYFYSDYACTIPYSVTNLPVSIQENITTRPATPDYPVSTTNTYTANGYSFSLGLMPWQSLVPVNNEDTFITYEYRYYVV